MKKPKYLIVDESSKVIETFNNKITAVQWLSSLKKVYGNKLMVINKNDRKGSI